MNENKTTEGQEDLSTRLEMMTLDINNNWGTYSTPTPKAFEEVASLLDEARDHIAEREERIKELELTLRSKFPESHESMLGLFEVCAWWILTYPSDIFVSAPPEIVKIRELMKVILCYHQKSALLEVNKEAADAVQDLSR